MLERTKLIEVGRVSALGAWAGAGLKSGRIAERRDLALIELAAFGRGEIARAALSRTLGLDLPGAGAATEAGGVAALSVGPGRWLLIGSEPAVHSLPTPSEDDAAITDLSGGRTILTLTGVHAIRTLMKGTAVDLDPTVFAPGTVAATALQRMPAIIWRRGDAYDVIVPRSYAVAMRDWLVAAGGS